MESEAEEEAEEEAGAKTKAIIYNSICLIYKTKHRRLMIAIIL